MAGKAAKTPKLFPVRIPEKRFQAAILRRIYTTGDRDYLLGLYRLEQDGSRVRAEELGAEDAKRLASLAKSVARNRGAVQVPKLVILAVIAAAILAFNLFFKNALLSRGLEAGLEAVFGARAEVAGLDFRLLVGSLSIRHLAVADKDRPMRNLFELGRTEASVDTLRLLEGRVHVRNLECRDLRWNTARTVSGALTRSEETAAEAEPSKEGGGLKKAAAGLLEALDIPSLLDEQEGRLSSAAKLRAANERLAALERHWSATLDKSRTELQAVSASVEEIRRFDIASVSTPKDAQKILELMKTASPAVKSLAADLTAATKQIAADTQSAKAEQALVQEAIDADVAALKAGLNLSGGWKSLASAVGERLLQGYLGKFSGYALKAKDAGLALLKGRRGDKKAKARPLSRQGRLVMFPGASSPRFLLSQAAFSSGPQSDLPGLEASVKNITSDPDILGRPVSFQASAQAAPERGGQAVSLEGTLDSRASRQTDVQVGLKAENWQLNLREALESLSLASLSAKADLTTDFRLLTGGGASGAGSILLRSLDPRPLADEPLGAAIGQALASVSSATVDFSFNMARQGEPAAVAVRTNLDEVLSRAVGEQAGRLASQYEGKLREELTRRLDAELKDNEALASGLSQLEKAAGADLATAGSYGKTIADAQKELERKLRTTIPLPKLGF